MSARTVAALALILLSGCAVLPNTVAPEIEHMSHASQHEPFTDHPTRYGAEIASIVAHWDLPKRFTLELAEGIDLDRHYCNGDSNGEIEGPREEFSARIAYTFTVRQ